MARGARRQYQAKKMVTIFKFYFLSVLQDILFIYFLVVRK